jgi:hypothetical protein
MRRITDVLLGISEQKISELMESNFFKRGFSKTALQANKRMKVGIPDAN